MPSKRKQRYHEFEPSSVQKQFLNDTSKQVLLYGGFGGGKTRTMCEKLYKMNMKYPGNRALLTRSHFSDVKKSTVEQSLLEDVIPDSHIPEGGHNKSSHVIKHLTGEYGPNGEPIMSEIHYHGLGSQGTGSNDGLPRKVSGMQFGVIGVDEATETTESQYTQLIGRLRYTGRTVGDKKYRIPFRQMILSTNPAGKSHYLYRKFFDEGVGSKYHLRPHDNPGVPEDYVEQLEDNYSGVFYERYVAGKWVGTDDVVFDEYDSRKHEVDMGLLDSLGFTRSPIHQNMIVPPEDWDVYRGVDFGYPSPMVVQWWACPPQERTDETEEAGIRRGEGDLGPLVMFREFYQSETLVEDVADRIRDWSKDLSINQTFADPAQAQDRETLSRHGVSSTEAMKDVWNGIQAVKGEMSREYFDADIPGILFYEDARINAEDSNLKSDNKPTKTTQEIHKYEWKSNADKPKKRDDHGMDAMRYVVYTLAQNAMGPSRSEMEDWESLFNSGGF